MTDSIDALTKQNIAQALGFESYDESKISADILEKIKSDKNSNASFTARFKDRLKALIDDDLSFVVKRTSNYNLIWQHAENLSPQAC